MYFLTQELFFPAVYEANPDGILAIGGDLSPERLLLAYKSGIFPWFEEGEPLFWWAPNPRMVLFLDELVVSKVCVTSLIETFLLLLSTKILGK